MSRSYKVADVETEEAEGAAGGDPQGQPGEGPAPALEEQQEE